MALLIITAEQLQHLFMKLSDELMSSFVPQTTALGGLPHLSYIHRKPKPLGTEGKVTGCGETGELKCLVTAQSCCTCLVAQALHPWFPC
jgi:hypothetical protein